MPNARLTVIVAILVIAPSTAIASSHSGVPPATMRWLERLYDRATCPLTRLGEEDVPFIDLQDAQDAFQRAVRKYGPTPQILSELAQVQFRLGDCSAAVRSYRKALELAPDSQSIALDLHQAQTLAWVARGAAAALPKGQRILRVTPARQMPESDLWFVLTANVSGTGLWDTECKDGFLSLFRLAGSHVELIWQSAQLGGGCNDWSDLQLYVTDLTGDGIKEAAVLEQFIAADRLPTHLDVYKWRDKAHLAKLVGVTGDLNVLVRDLNRDGRCELITSTPFGADLSFAEEPWWDNIYRYRNGHYELADGDFPKRYRTIVSTIRKLLAQHPHDEELWEYLGVADHILHRPRQARRELRRAEDLARKDSCCPRAILVDIRHWLLRVERSR